MHIDSVKEQLAYLKGLSSGLNIDTSSSEGRVLTHIVQVLDTLTGAMEKMNEDFEQLSELVTALDSDLTDLEEDFYDEYDDDVQLSSSDGLDYLAIDCPFCRETIYVNESRLEDDGCATEVICPECEETILLNDGQTHDNRPTVHYVD